MTVAARLTSALSSRAELKNNKSELARRAGLNPTTVRAYFQEGPDGRHPPLDVCEALGKVLAVRAKWIFDGLGTRQADPDPNYYADSFRMPKFEPVKVPLLDSVAAGKLTRPASQIPVEDVPLLAFADLGPGEFFALRVIGTSMDRVSPEDSIIVVNRRDKQLINGKCYVFGLKGETTYKRWQGGETDYLESYSTDPRHTPIFLGKKKDWEVIGRVKRTVLDL